MYIRKISLNHIKTFEQFEWKLDDDKSPAGWHVLLGDNGSGKSTLIRSAAVALMGVEDAVQTRVPFETWVSQGQVKGDVQIELVSDPSFDRWSEEPSQPYNRLKIGVDFSTNGLKAKRFAPTATKHIWADKGGWFCASYGPFRRFSGGSNAYQVIYDAKPKLARHLSVFGEDVALSATLDWFEKLRFKQLEDSASIEAKLLDNIKGFLNQDDFLPNNVKMHGVTSDGVLFIDSAGCELSIEALSDGYRSILSVMLELIRQMVSCYKTSEIFSAGFETIDYPGVVFIDEIDVHLHPSWQRKIGTWLTQHFPNIQFIVSTHSPLVCQGAANGSIWQLPKAGDAQSARQLTGVLFDRLVYGNIQEALSSGAFGDEIERSDEANAMLQELAELNYLMLDQTLLPQQKQRHENLQRIFATSSHVTKA